MPAARSPRPVTNAQIWSAVGGLTASVEGMRDDFHRSDDQARDYREKIYERIEKLDQRTGRLEDTVGEMKPTVENLSNLRLKAAGVVLTLSLGLSAIAGLVTIFAGEIKGAIFRVLGIH